MRYVIQIILLSLLSSCCVRNADVRQNIVELSSKPIIMPLNGITTISGDDVVLANYFDSSCKMIIYSDSTSCTSCNIKTLFKWDSIIKYSNDYKGDLKFYFILYSNCDESTRVALRNSHFDYPVLLDTLGEFERLNPHLPKNKAMHTFLLDEDNNVILVGNPLHNKQVEKMFYEEVEKRLK